MINNKQDYSWDATFLNERSRDFLTAPLTLKAIKKINSGSNSYYSLTFYEGIKYFNRVISNAAVFSCFPENVNNQCSLEEVFFYFINKLNKKSQIPVRRTLTSDVFCLALSDIVISEIRKEKTKWDALGYTKKEDLTQENKIFVDQGIKKNESQNNFHGSTDLGKADFKQRDFRKDAHQNFSSWNRNELRKYHCSDINCPRETRNQVTKLDISNQSLHGSLELEGFSNLEELDCSGNYLNTLEFLNNLNKEKLTKLYISNNEFTSDLTSFSEFVNLERLHLNNSSFAGSLKPLAGLTKLKSLNIVNTSLDSGLEYLPESIKWLNCSFEKPFCNSFVNEKGKMEIDMFGMKNFPQSLKQYKQKNERWKKLNFSEEEIKKWIKVDLMINDYELADYLRKKGYNPSSWYSRNNQSRILKEH